MKLSTRQKLADLHDNLDKNSFQHMFSLLLLFAWFSCRRPMAALSKQTQIEFGRGRGEVEVNGGEGEGLEDRAGCCCFYDR